MGCVLVYSVQALGQKEATYMLLFYEGRYPGQALQGYIIGISATVVERKHGRA
jgi:hypothetical protein